MIDPDHGRQTMVPHQGLEPVQRAGELLVRAGATTQQIAAVAVAHREWIAALAVAEGKPALKIHRPHLIGLHRLSEPGIERMIDSRRAATTHTLPVTPQNLSDGAARRR